MLSKGPPLQAFVSHFSSPLLLPIRAVKARAIATWGNLKQHGSELINNKESFKNSNIWSVDMDVDWTGEHVSATITLQNINNETMSRIWTGGEKMIWMYWLNH